MTERNTAGPSRRDFIRDATAAAVGTAAVARFHGFAGAHAAGSDEIRVGLVGCGGRGSGAAGNVLAAAPGVRIVALADAFQDRLTACRDRLAQQHPDVATVAQDHCFVGLDAYQQLLKTDVNYVILASPPGFRATHIKAAIAAGKNIFAEKPVAVDATAVRSCISLADEVTKRGIALGAGTQYRHFDPYIQSMKRIHDGAIGQLTGARAYYNTGELWKRDRQEGWSDLENQMRNWLYYTWLSGDHIVEQFIHNIDALNWAFNGHPLRATGTGGRQVRTAPEFGHIYDHFAIVYEYDNDTFATAMCRQQNGCEKKVANEFTGTKGTAYVLPDYSIKGATTWKYDAPEPNDMYVQEHTDLIASIRAGKPLNELKQVAESSLTAIMGRMTAYSGKTITWDEALNSTESLMPATLTWGPMPTPPVAMPGLSTD
jgi:myo-inositol 2-dehydrogenase / D-chiro-inositol 1-dehydrogenase